MASNTLIYKKNADGLYECQHCGVTYKKQNTMHYHLKKHEGTLPYKCKYCDKAFLQKQTMDQHIAAKHAEKTDQLPCPCCKFQSTTVANLKIHFMRIHCKDICKFTINKDDAGSTVTCDHCTKEFNSKTAYYYHTLQCKPPAKTHAHYSEYVKIMN